MAVVETMTFRSAPGVTDADLLAADRRVQTEFVPNRPGFLRRTTARADDGREWIVVTLWESSDAAAAAAADEAGHPAPEALAALVDPGSVARARFTTLD